MSYKKYIGVVILLAVIGLWAYLVMDVNRRYPKPENIRVQSGETISYQGIKVIPGEMEIYDYQSLIRQYPRMKAMGRSVDEELISHDECYFIVPITIENIMESRWESTGTSLVSWVIETGSTANGMDYFAFKEMNPEYDGILEPGESQKISLIFSIIGDYITMDQALQWDKKIVFSYYPNKNFLYYQGQDSEKIQHV